MARRRVAVPAVIIAISSKWCFFTLSLSPGTFFRRIPIFPF